MIESFLSAYQYTTVLYVSSFIFGFGLLVTLCFCLAKYYADGCVQYLWALCAAGTMFITLIISGIGGYYGYQGYSKAQHDAARERLQQEAQQKKQLPEELSILDDDYSDSQSEKDNEEKTNRHFPSDEEKEYYRLGGLLKEQEIELREKLKQDENDMKRIDEAYKNGEMSTYDQLLAKAKQEQIKRQHIIDTMNSKINQIQSTDILDDAEKQEALAGNQSRLENAERELAQYQEVERVLIERKEDYLNL